ncbi:MAG: CHASE2 domain-containing protein [Nitrospinota bacterium]
MKTVFKPHSFIIFAAATLLVFFFSLFAGNVAGRLELLIQDIFYAQRGKMKPSGDVVIAAIDEKSIDKLGKWPWPRNVMADLVDSLTAYGVKVIGFDVVFSSPDSSSGTRQLLNLEKRLYDAGLKRVELKEVLGRAVKESDNDQRFHDALQKSRRAVLGYFFYFSRKEIKHLSEKEMEGYLDIIKKSRYSGFKKEPSVSLNDIPLIRAQAVEATIKKISSATKRAGYFNFVPESDGSVRKVPLIVKYRDLVEQEGDDDYLFPPLALTVLRKYLKSAVIFWIGGDGVDKVALMGREPRVIPTNSRGEMRINYYGPKGTFAHYSAVDILNGEAAPELLKDKIVLVGATATAIEDVRFTPFDTYFPGVEIHATIIDNILNGKYLAEPSLSSGLIQIIGVMVVGLILLLSVPRLNAVAGGGIALALVAAIFGLHYVFFSHYRLVLNTVPPLLETVLVYASLGIYRFITEEREKRYIQSAFGQYLSPQVIEEIIKDPSKLELGGSRRELTVMFSDLADFSRIAETMDAEELVPFLNGYLSRMSGIIQHYNGTLDKYEGDAIIAFFGAPINYADHAARCCLAALEMQEELGKMRRVWEKEGKPALTMRIGINSGMMAVGNFGSETRMAYTIMGDSVNLAARLEGANKQYATHAMISSYTYAYCKDAVEVRELDTLRVVGKKEVVTVYELLCKKGELKPDKEKILSLYKEGRAFYMAREWQNAIDKFGEILDMDINDGPALTYMERCMDFKQRPPDKNWDGTYIMKDK